MALLSFAYTLSICTLTCRTCASRKVRGREGREGWEGRGGREEIVPTFLDGQIHRPFATGGTEQCRQRVEEGGGYEGTHAFDERGVLYCCGWGCRFVRWGLVGGWTKKGGGQEGRPCTSRRE